MRKTKVRQIVTATMAVIDGTIFGVPAAFRVAVKAARVGNPTAQRAADIIAARIVARGFNGTAVGVKNYIMGRG